MKGGRTPKRALKSVLTEKFPVEFNPLGSDSFSVAFSLVVFEVWSGSVLECDVLKKKLTTKQYEKQHVSSYYSRIS